MSEQESSEPSGEIVLTEILKDAYLIVETGGKGSGKTASGAVILQLFHNKGWEACWMPYRRPIPKNLLPPWMRQTDPTNPKLVGHTVYFMDDWHLTQHAREWRSSSHVDVNKTITIARHLDCKFILNTQTTTQVDTTNIRDVDAWIFRRPSVLDEEEDERPSVRKKRAEATRCFEDLKEKGVDLKTCMYVYTEDYIGMLTNVPLPTFWTEELSTYLKGARRIKK